MPTPGRAFQYEMIGYIFGEDRHRVGEYIQEYEEKVGKIGLDLSILDLDFNHDYLSAEDARTIGAPHSRIDTIRSQLYHNAFSNV